MKSSIRFKINRLIAGAVVLITAVLVCITLLVVNSFSRSYSDTMLLDSVNAQAIKLDSQQESVEQAVLSIYEISKYVEGDYLAMDSSEQIENYFKLFESTAISIANNTKGSAAVYYRLSPQVAGDGKQGFLYIRDSKNGKFVKNELTDILKYDEDDIEHVGWYYIPIKARCGTWISPYYNANLGLQMMSYVLPIFDGDTPVGVIGMDVDFDDIIATAEDVNAFESSGANLIDIKTERVYYNKCDLLGDKLSKRLVSVLSRGDRSSQLIPISLNNESYKMHFATLHNGMKLIAYAKDADIYKAGSTVIVISSIIFAIVFLMTLIIAIRLSNKIVNPIVEINAATKEYAKGNWDVDLSCDSDDELGELTKSILDMAHNTKKSMDNLSDALVVAQEASKAKSTFLSNVSHDIRTPMNAILSYTQFAIEQPEISKKTHSYLDNILKANNHLLSLINSVLEMSRIESGKTQIDVSACNIRELIEELNTLVYANVAEKNQTLTINVSGIKHENVMCDSLRFNQVMINLLGNAIKFTEDGGRISVTATEEDSVNPNESTYHFVVKDSGIGIDESFIANLFTPFEREKDSTINSIQGTGLGLAISKNLIEMMGGSISVKSKRGVGTEFFIDVLFSHSSEGETAGSDTSDPDSEKEELRPVDLSSLRVLLVEDNKVNRLIVKEIFGDKVKLLDEAVNGKEAIDILKEHEPDYYSLVLMDVQMPEMDGYEATKIIRSMEDDKLANIPIIAMTANAFEEDKRNAYNAGMNAHIAKPIDVAVLMKTIQSLIAEEGNPHLS